VDATTAVDLSAGLASLALLFAYEAYERYRVRRDPSFALAGLNVIARTGWVRYIMEKRDYILAVQTLRNSGMTASFMASSAVLLLIGVMNLAAQSEEATLWRSLNAFGHASPQLWLLKLMVLVMILFAGFFFFLMSIRLYNHVGYMVAAAPGDAGAMSPEAVTRVLNRAGTYLNLGIRTYYADAVVTFWLFGPPFAFICAVVLVLVLWRTDLHPVAAQHDIAP
jgi:uncharacterized membrane protein